MRRSFFNLNELSVANATPTLPRCGLCGLYRTCHTPRMKPTGEGKRGILMVAEANGKNEDLKGTQLIGGAGQVLRKILRSIGIDLDRDCWKTNALICRPVNNKLPKNPQPIIDACRPNLLHTIKKLQPHTIILLGKTAASSLIPFVWKDKIADFGKWTGWDIPCQKLNVNIGITWHPSYLLRTKNDLLELLTRKHLKQAFGHTKRPWDVVPDYKSEIEVINRPYAAAKIIRDMIRIGKPISWDLETNALKPEEVGAEIVCCSICQNGKRTIAYPWSGEAMEATAELLRSPVKKIGANIKFEERWMLRHMGLSVRGWFWDTVIAAHIADNRTGVSGVKFQSFVSLGMESYNENIEQYLKPQKGKRLNRIRELEIKDILCYNGMDSLVEYKIAIKQMKAMQKLERSMNEQGND